LAEVTGDPRWDAAGSLGIGLLLGVIAIVLATEMKSLLIGEAVSPQLGTRIREAICDGAEVRRVIHLPPMHQGPEDVLLATKVELACDTMPELAQAIDTVEARVRESVPIVKLMFVEPDVYRDEPDAPSPDGQGET